MIDAPLLPAQAPIPAGTYGLAETAAQHEVDWRHALRSVRDAALERP